eukprot:ANDGO_02743.mRNA.1 Halomucin
MRLLRALCTAFAFVSLLSLPGCVSQPAPSWTPHVTLSTDAVPPASPGIGVAVDSTGSVVVASDGYATSGYESSGEVFVFKSNSFGNYSVFQKLHLATGYLGGQLGTSLAISSDGNVIVAGAPYWVDASAGSVTMGYANVYVRNASSNGYWGFVQTLRPNTTYLVPGGTVQFGLKCAMSSSSSVIAISAPYQGSEGCTGCGVVHVFRRSGSFWNLEKSLVSPSVSSTAVFGYYGLSVSPSGNLVAASSHTYNNNDGAVWVYEYSGGSWTPPVRIDGSSVAYPSFAGRLFGLGVDLYRDDGLTVTGYAVSSVQFFLYSAGVWTENTSKGFRLCTFAGYDCSASYQLATSVRASRSNTALRVAVGNFGFSGNLGSVSVLTLDGGSWVLLGTMTGRRGFLDKLGNAIACSDDLSTVLPGMNPLIPGRNAPFALRTMNFYYNASAVSSSFLSWNSTTLPLIASRMTAFQTVSAAAGGKVLAIGNPWDSELYLYGGKVVLYCRVSLDAAWVIGERISLPQQVTTYSYFGLSISFSEDGASLAVGAPYYSCAAPTQYRHGCVLLFERNFSRSCAYDLRTYISPPSGGPVSDGGWFGNPLRMDLSGSKLAISAPLDNNNNGAVLLYDITKSGSNWSTSFVQKLTAPPGINGQMFGSGLAISADRSRIVAGINGNAASSVFVFNCTSTNCSLRSALYTGVGISTSAYASSYLQLDGNGSTLVVGLSECSNSTVSEYAFRLGGTHGCVKVYFDLLQTGEFTLAQTIFPDDGVENHYGFGFSVSSDTAMNVLAIGAIYFDRIYIYQKVFRNQLMSTFQRSGRAILLPVSVVESFVMSTYFCSVDPTGNLLAVGSVRDSVIRAFALCPSGYASRNGTCVRCSYAPPSSFYTQPPRSFFNLFSKGLQLSCPVAASHPRLTSNYYASSLRQQSTLSFPVSNKTNSFFFLTDVRIDHSDESAILYAICIRILRNYVALEDSISLAAGAPPGFSEIVSTTSSEYKLMIVGPATVLQWNQLLQFVKYSNSAPLSRRNTSSKLFECSVLPAATCSPLSKYCYQLISSPSYKYSANFNSQDSKNYGVHAFSPSPLFDFQAFLAVVSSPVDVSAISEICGSGANAFWVSGTDYGSQCQWKYDDGPQKAVNFASCNASGTYSTLPSGFRVFIPSEVAASSKSHVSFFNNTGLRSASFTDLLPSCVQYGSPSDPPVSFMRFSVTFSCSSGGYSQSSSFLYDGITYMSTECVSCPSESVQSPRYGLESIASCTSLEPEFSSRADWIQSKGLFPYGAVISNDGLTVVTSADNVDSLASGALYVFRRTSRSVSFPDQPSSSVDRLNLGNANSRGLGTCLALSEDGSILLALSTNHYVHVLSWDGTAYVRRQSIKAVKNFLSFPRVRLEISGDGSTFVVGDSSNGYEELYTYQLVSSNPVTFSLLGNLTQPIEDASTNTASSFGFSVCLSANGLNMTVGNIYFTLRSSTWYGQVFSFGRQAGSDWVFIGNSSAVSGYFGYSCAMSADGKLVAIGAPIASSAGVVFLYSAGDSALTLYRRLELPSGQRSSNEYLGYSLQMSRLGDLVVSGAPYYEASSLVASSGRVVSFRRSLASDTWSASILYSCSGDMTNCGAFIGMSSTGLDVVVTPNGNVYFHPQNNFFVHLQFPISSYYSAVNPPLYSVSEQDVGTNVSMCDALALTGNSWVPVLYNQQTQKCSVFANVSLGSFEPNSLLTDSTADWTVTVMYAPGSLSYSALTLPVSDVFPYPIASSRNGTRVVMALQHASSLESPVESHGQIAFWPSLNDDSIYDAQWSTRSLVPFTTTVSQANDRLGSALCISDDGSEMIVGGPFTEQRPATLIGTLAHYRFNESANGWDFVQFIFPPSRPDRTGLGSALACSSNLSVIVAGAYLTTYRGTSPCYECGDVFIFNRMSSSAPFVFSRNLSVPVEVLSDDLMRSSSYGATIDSSKDMLSFIVGAMRANLNSTNGGGVFFFDCPHDPSLACRSVNVSSYRQNPAANDLLGYSVAMSGDGLVAFASASYEESDPLRCGVDTGAIYVFNRPTRLDSWTVVNRIVPFDCSNSNTRFGSGLFVPQDKNVLYVSAFNNDAVKTDGGMNYVYEFTTAGDVVFRARMYPFFGISTTTSLGLRVYGDAAATRMFAMSFAPSVSMLHAWRMDCNEGTASMFGKCLPCPSGYEPLDWGRGCVRKQVVPVLGYVGYSNLSASRDTLSFNTSFGWRDNDASVLLFSVVLKVVNFDPAVDVVLGLPASSAGVFVTQSYSLSSLSLIVNITGSLNGSFVNSILRNLSLNHVPSSVNQSRSRVFFAYAIPSSTCLISTRNCYECVLKTASYWCADANSKERHLFSLSSNAPIPISRLGFPGYLATITSKEEQSFVQKMCTGGPCFIGASSSDTPGVWRWISGPEAGQVLEVRNASGTFRSMFSLLPASISGTQLYALLSQTSSLTWVVSTAAAQRFCVEYGSINDVQPVGFAFGVLDVSCPHPGYQRSFVVRNSTTESPFHVDPSVSFNVSQCVFCDPQFYSNSSTGYLCVPCLASGYAVGPNRSSCTICPSNMFVNSSTLGLFIVSGIMVCKCNDGFLLSPLSAWP